jgi:hypothetical protein
VLLGLSVLLFGPIGVLCVLLLLNPFETNFRLRYGLKTLFFATTVLCVLLGLASLEAGPLFLGLCLVFVGPIGLLYILVAAFSWTFGTLGERQRRNQARNYSSQEEIAAPDVSSDTG